mgnify:CR=1 FL=1
MCIRDRFFTAADMKEVGTIKPTLARFEYRAVEQPVLPRDRVHFVGQPIAAVIAATAEEAEDIVEAATLEIEADQAVVGFDDALAPGAPLVHAIAPGNVIVEGALRQPGVDAAFAAAHHVAEFAFRSGRQNATPLEGRGGCA